MLQWDNMYYTSSDPHRPPVILTPQLIDKGEDSSAAPFFYAAGVVSNSVYLSRLRMPDWSNGHISWKGSLFSSRRNFFINGECSRCRLFLSLRGLGEVVQWQGARMSHGRPGFDSQQPIQHPGIGAGHHDALSTRKTFHV